MFKTTILILTLIYPSVCIAKLKTLEVAVTEDFPPFYFKEENVYKGATIEIVNEVFKRMGYKLKFNVAPMARLLRGLGSGKYDLSPNITATDERRKYAYFSEVPILYESQDLIVIKDSKVKFNGNLHAMRTYTFGAMHGWTHGPNFDSAHFLKKQFRNTSEQQLRSLIAGRFDVAVNNKAFFMRKAKDLGLENKVKVLSPSTYNLPVTIAVSSTLSNREELIIKFDKELIKIKKENMYREILKRYGIKPIIE